MAQLHQAQQPIMSTYKHSLTLSEKKVDSKMRIPNCYGGYALTDLHIETVRIQTEFLVQHLRNGNSVGRRMKIQLSQHQLESGLREQVVSKKGRPGYLTKTWITNLLNNLAEYGLHLRTDHWQQDDNGGPTIMEVFRNN